jgi:hypothetical protein
LEEPLWDVIVPQTASNVVVVSKNIKNGVGESAQLLFYFSSEAQGLSEICSESVNSLCATVNSSRCLDCSDAFLSRFQSARQLINKGKSLVGFHEITLL